MDKRRSRGKKNETYLQFSLKASQAKLDCKKPLVEAEQVIGGLAFLGRRGQCGRMPPATVVISIYELIYVAHGSFQRKWSQTLPHQG